MAAPNKALNDMPAIDRHIASTRSLEKPMKIG